jgi:hypothetical protein
VSDTIEDVTAALPELGDADAPVSEIVADVSETIDTLASTADPLLDTVGEIADGTDPIGPLLETADAGIDEAPILDDVVASADSIVTETLAAASDIGLDDLFSDGSYTDLGLQLQIDVSTDESGSPTVTADASSSSLGIDADAQLEPDSSGMTSGNVEIAGVDVSLPGLDSLGSALGLRSFGDLWG